MFATKCLAFSDFKLFQAKINKFHAQNVSLQLFKCRPIGCLKICRPISIYRGLSRGILQVFLHIFIDGLNIRFPRYSLEIFQLRSFQTFLAVEVFWGEICKPKTFLESAGIFAFICSLLSI